VRGAGGFGFPRRWIASVDDRICHIAHAFGVQDSLSGCGERRPDIGQWVQRLIRTKAPHKAILTVLGVPVQG